MSIETVGSIAADHGVDLWRDVRPEKLYSVEPRSLSVAEFDCENSYTGGGGSGGSVPRFSGTKDAMQCTAYWACVSLLSRTIASLPKNVMVKDANGSRTVAEDHPFNYVLHSVASLELTSFEFWERGIVHLMTHGNIFARIIRDGRGQCIELQLLNPLRMQVTRDYATGIRVYTYYNVNGPQEYFTDVERKILHIPAMSANDLLGVSPIAQFAQTIDLSNTTETVQLKFFENGALAPAVISVPGTISKETQDRIVESVKSQTGTKTRWGNVLILQNNAELKPIDINFVNMQLIDLRKFEVEDIARIHGVPLHLIQSLDKATNNNIEHQSIDFAQHTISPICVRIEQRLNMVVLGVRESLRHYCKINIKGIMRGDTKSRGEYYSKMFMSGAYSPNDILRLEDEERIPASQGGDAHFVPAGMVSLDIAQDLEPGSGTAAPVAPADEGDSDEDEEETTP